MARLWHFIVSDSTQESERDKSMSLGQSILKRTSRIEKIANTLRRCPFRLLNLASSQGLMDERQDATTSDRRSHERVKLLVSPNS